MRILLSQLEVLIADIEGNTAKIISQIEESKSDNIDLLVFSELILTGYIPEDYLLYNSFLDSIERALAKILSHINDSLYVILGTPTRYKERLYNSLLVLNSGKIVHCYDKTLLPNYGVFNDGRYFLSSKESERNQNIFSIKGKIFGLTICEDIWLEFNKSHYPINIENPLDSFYNKESGGVKIDYLVNISASPFTKEKHSERLELTQSIFSKLQVPIIYVNQVAFTSEILFDGGSIYKKEDDSYNLTHFSSDSLLIDTSNDFVSKEATPYKEAITELKTFNFEIILKSLVFALKNYCINSGIKKVALGLSGGIDSAVVASIATIALGKENVYGLLLPSMFSSSHSISDSLELASNLGIKTSTIEISSIYDSTLFKLEELYGKTPFDTTEENLQSRIRGLILMAFSNKEGYGILNTTNKSEMAVGYGTLYGDTNGFLSLLGDLYKWEIYKLAELINRNHKIIPLSIIKKEPSAELRSDQKDSDSLPDYPTLDAIIYLFLEEKKSALEIKELGYNCIIVNKILSLIDKNEFKRYQAPPIVNLSISSLGKGRKIILNRFF